MKKKPHLEGRVRVDFRVGPPLFFSNTGVAEVDRMIQVGHHRFWKAEVREVTITYGLEEATLTKMERGDG